MSSSLAFLFGIFVGFIWIGAMVVAGKYAKKKQDQQVLEDNKQLARFLVEELNKNAKS